MKLEKKFWKNKIDKMKENKNRLVRIREKGLKILKKDEKLL